ncbi:MAG TPA: glycoside hydrolase family 127 protein [Acidobacteriaceae bacterium]|nr:glycoside hydrolase family 127 protein [Acidobacteriaceae bacterium]
MKHKVTRRGFLGGAALFGTAALLPSTASALKESAPAFGTGKDTAVQSLTESAVAKVKWNAKPFSMTDVRLLPSFWKDMMELNRSWLYSLPNDRLAHMFRVTAGIPSDADPLGGWEAPDCELRGHFAGGHYLSGCALLYASTGDTVIANKAAELVNVLSQCQSKDGYLGAYPADFYDRLRNHKRVWAPFYTYHKIMAGHIDMYQHCGNKQALETAEGMARWAKSYVDPISDADFQKMMNVEYGGMQESLFNLYGITGKEEYAELARRFSHHDFFDPLAQNQDDLPGLHANTHIPQVIGAQRGYELTGDEKFRQISQNFYQIVLDHHSYATGGTSNGEFWHKSDAIATQLGPAAEECCCSYNMMKLARHLFGQQPDAKHFDYYERLLYNVRYGTQDRNGMLMYYVPLESGMYKTFGTPFDSFWCCTGTGSEEYSKLNNSIYFHDNDGVFVNLFIPSTLDWKERGFKLRQTTKFPNEERITFNIESAPSKPTALKIRVPYWATGGFNVAINGSPQDVTATPSSYSTLQHDWKAGDVITIDIPLTLHVDTAPDDKTAQVAMYGPLVLAARLGTEDLTLSMIYGDSGPRGWGDAYPMPKVDMKPFPHRENGKWVEAPPPDPNAVWFEQAEATREYPLVFRTKGRGLKHTLVPLNQIMDERYSVYLHNATAEPSTMFHRSNS